MCGKEMNAQEFMCTGNARPSQMCRIQCFYSMYLVGECSIADALLLAVTSAARLQTFLRCLSSYRLALFKLRVWKIMLFSSDACMERSERRWHSNEARPRPPVVHPLVCIVFVLCGNLLHCLW